jgi:hypothetical protein
MNISRIFVLVLLIILSANSYAEGNNKNDLNPLVAVGLFEGIIAVNAWMASKNPQVYGGLAVLLFPVAAAETKNETTFWVSLAAAESLAIYNIGLDEDKYSEGAIFKKNMIGWHLFAGVVGLTAWLSEDDKKEEKVSMAFLPTSNGGELRLGYRF